MSKKTNKSEIVQVDLSTKKQDELVIMYMEENFSDATKNLLEFLYKHNVTLKDVLYNAVVNEMTNTALRDYIQSQEDNSSNVK